MNNEQTYNYLLIPIAQELHSLNSLHKPIAPLQKLHNPQMNHAVVFVKTQKKEKRGQTPLLERCQRKVIKGIVSTN